MFHVYVYVLCFMFYVWFQPSPTMWPTRRPRRPWRGTLGFDLDLILTIVGGGGICVVVCGGGGGGVYVCVCSGGGGRWSVDGGRWW